MKLPKIRPWTIALLMLIIIDSILTSGLVTLGVAAETNPLILWVMKTFGLTINEAMIARIIAILPSVAIVNKYDFGKKAVICYVVLYLIISLVMLI
jgi:hypothetical protein